MLEDNKNVKTPNEPMSCENASTYTFIQTKNQLNEKINMIIEVDGFLDDGMMNQGQKTLPDDNTWEEKAKQLEF